MAIETMSVTDKIQEIKSLRSNIDRLTEKMESQMLAAAEPELVDTYMEWKAYRNKLESYQSKAVLALSSLY